MANSNSWYARYFRDYEEKTAHLSLIEHGAYSLLLDYYYKRSGKLPANAEQLLRICRSQGEAEARAVLAVADEFFPIGEDGLRHNARCDEEIKKAEELSQKRATAGKEGVKAKQKRQANELPNAKAIALANGQANHPAIAPTVTVTYIQDEKQKEKIKKKKNEKIAQLTELEKAFEVFWAAYPNRVDKQDAKKAYLKLNPDPELQEKILFAIDAQLAEREIKAKHNVWAPDWKMPATWLNKKTWENEIAEESVIAKQPKMRGNYEKPKSKVDIHGEACASAFAGLPSDFFDNLDTSEFAIGGTVERLD